MFKIHQCVRAVSTVHFVDNTFHRQGNKFIITEDTLAYFNCKCNSNDYELVR